MMECSKYFGKESMNDLKVIFNMDLIPWNGFQKAWTKGCGQMRWYYSLSRR
jgi:hypothetical protein